MFTPESGKPEMNFVDYWKYNIAAVRLAEMVGLADMMPPTIEYRYDGKPGALAWWMDTLMNEGERLKKKIGRRTRRRGTTTCTASACSWSWCGTTTAISPTS